MERFTPLAKVDDGWIIGNEAGELGWASLEFVLDVVNNHPHLLSDWRFIPIEGKTAWITFHSENNETRIEINKGIVGRYTIRCGFSAEQKIWVAATPKRILQINYA